MPTYEYECGNCARNFEIDQRITDDPIKTCPHCRSKKIKRLISRTSFVLKGGGWYSDLYSSGKPDKKADAKPDGKTPDGGSSAGSADEKKSEPKDKKPGKEKSSSKDSGKGSPKAAA